MYQTIDIPTDNNAYITVAYNIVDGEVVIYSDLAEQDYADALEAIYECDEILNG